MSDCYKCVKVPKMMEDLEDRKDNMKDGEYLTRSNIIMKLYEQATCDCKPKSIDDMKVGEEIQSTPLGRWGNWTLNAVGDDYTEFFIGDHNVDDDEPIIASYWTELNGTVRETRLGFALTTFRDWCETAGLTNPREAVFYNEMADIVQLQSRLYEQGLFRRYHPSNETAYRESLRQRVEDHLEHIASH